MGVLTVGGSSGGFANYMIHGNKSGRELHRNQLDKRVWLHGDLKALDNLVESMERKGEKMLHITFSFAEDTVSEETLRAVTERLKEFFSAGSTEGEMMFYAEAHIPKVKSYTSKKTGEVIQRKPHIHIGIPKINLLTGQSMDPLRMVRMQLPFLDAAQESINAESGLLSPKENPRMFEDASDIIGRLGGDMFVPVGRALKQEILDQIIDRKIESREAFQSLLAEYGEVRERNKGRHTAHFFVKPEPGPDGKQRNGTNLRDQWFRDDFIALPTAEKIVQLQADTKAWQERYIEQRAQLATPEVYEKVLQEWFSVKARELIRLNSGNRKQWTAYQLATLEEKKAILDRLDADFLKQHAKDNNHEQRTRSAGDRGFFYGHAPDGPESYARAARARAMAGHSLHELSGGGLAAAKGQAGSQGVLPDDVPAGHREPDVLRRESELHSGIVPDNARVGLLLAHGEANYKHKKDGSPSYFVKYRDHHGTEREVWGVDLQRALEELKPEIGERIALINHGQVKFTLRVPVLDEQGREVKHELKEAYRNDWEARTAPEAPEPPEAESPELTPEQAAEEAERLEKLRAAGEQIIEDPASVLAALTRTQSVFTRRELEKHLREHTADEAQYTLAHAAVLASPELVRLAGQDTSRGRDGRIVGEFIARGAAPFEHEPGGQPSYFVRYIDADGEPREVWGLGLRSAMDQLGAGPGDRIALTNQGRTPVTVREAVKDANGRITGYREKAAYRNAWLAEAAELELTNNLFSTREVRAIEQRLLDVTDRMASNTGAALSSESRAFAAHKRTFNEGQAAAFELLTDGAQLAIVNGAAGTGKSYVLEAMREAYEREGYTLYGAILQGKTADDLERDSGIKSRTMHSFLAALRKGQVQLDSKSVVVVDEAGMIGSRQMEELMSFAEKTGARVRLVGDAKQLHAVDYGNAFEHMSKRVQLASLTEIQRQKASPWMCEASMALSRHELAPAIRAYAENGSVWQHDTREAGKLALVERWNADRLSDPEKSQIMLTRTNQQRIELNQLMREKLRESGHLGAETTVQTESGKRLIAEGDRIVFLKNEYQTLNVKNGTAAVVQKVEGNTLTARLQDGRMVAVDLTTYGHIDYGYAMTVHKSQGMTVHRAYALLTPGMSAENTYVAMTRHKEELVVAYGKDDFRNENALIMRLGNAERKEFSTAYELAESAEARASLRRMLGLDEQGNIVAPVAQPGDGIGAAMRDVIERRAAAQAEQMPSWTAIKKTLDASRLLSYLERTHGIVPSKYQIVKAKDGSDRIMCGSTARSVNDFLTEEMALSLEQEAKPILMLNYAEQMRELQYDLKADPQKELWADFQAHRAAGQGEKDALLAEQKAAEIGRYEQLNEDYRGKRAKLGALLEEGKRGQHRAMLSIIQTERALEEQALKIQIDAERRALNDKINAPIGAQFRTWLADRAQHGDERAIAELRRQSLQTRDDMAHPVSIAPAAPVHAAQSAPLLRDIAHRIDHDGNVTYTRDGRDILRDQSASIAVLDQDAANVETALILARQRFGPQLKVTGDDAFKALVAKVVVERELNVRFTDDALNDAVSQIKAASQPTAAQPRASLAVPTPQGGTLDEAFNRLQNLQRDAAEAIERAAQQRIEEQARKDQERTLDSGDELDMG